LLVRSAEKVEDLVELVDVVAAFEEWLAAEKLGEDTTNGPDVDWEGLVVLRGGMQNEEWVSVKEK